MKNDYKKLISCLPELLPPQGLTGNVLKRIGLIDKRRTQIRLVSYTTLALSSCIGLIFASVDMIRQVSNSGIAYYFSLFASDQALVFSFAKEFVLSIAESLPAASLAVFLAFLGTFLWSSVRSAKSVGEARLSFLSV